MNPPGSVGIGFEKRFSKPGSGKAGNNDRRHDVYLIFNHEKNSTMSTSRMYHTQGIRGFQHRAFHFESGMVIAEIERKTQRCPFCRSGEVSCYEVRSRRIRGVPYGAMPVFFAVCLHRLYCRKCHRCSMETLPFLSHPEARITMAIFSCGNLGGFFTNNIVEDGLSLLGNVR